MDEFEEFKLANGFAVLSVSSPMRKSVRAGGALVEYVTHQIVVGCTR